MNLSIEEIDATGSLTAIYVQSDSNGKHRVDVIVSLSSLAQLGSATFHTIAGISSADFILSSRQNGKMSYGLACSVSFCQRDTQTV